MTTSTQEVPILSEKIRLLRESKGYTQEYLANQLNISQQAYSQIEKNPHKISIKRLNEVSNVLKIPINELLSTNKIEIFDPKDENNTNKYVLTNLEENRIFDRIISELKEEIIFLRSLIITLNK